MGSTYLVTARKFPGMSPSGTEPTFRVLRAISAIVGNPDIQPRAPDDRNRPRADIAANTCLATDLPTRQGGHRFNQSLRGCDSVSAVRSPSAPFQYPRL